MTLPLNIPSPLTRLRLLSRDQWFASGIKLAPRMVGALAVIGIAWQAAQLTWLILSPKPAVTAQPTQIAPPANSASNSGVNPQTIADAHLFGLPTADTSQADPNNLPQTQVNLVLAGTIALDNPEDGFAIVGENAAAAKFYRVGTVINGAVRLHAVYADRVIIDRAGTLETLVLPRGPGNGIVQPPRAAVNAPNPVGDNLRRLVNSNPGALSQLMRAQPVFSNGTQKGYRVYPGRDRLQFTRLGLQPGDLITAINGTPLDDPNRSNDILNTMASSSNVNVSIERNGAAMQLSLDMGQISLPDAGTPPTAAQESPGADSATPDANKHAPLMPAPAP